MTFTYSRILVTGSRDWEDASAIRLVLANYARRGGFATLISGHARGADQIAETIWENWGLAVERHPADWTQFGKRAGFVRNAEMVNLGADVCLAFIRNGSKGATHTADLAERAGIQTIRYEATS